jgi:hypothetical protein
LFFENFWRNRMRLLHFLTLLIFVHALPVNADQRSANGLITIAAVGDVMMGSDFPASRLPPRGGSALLREARPYFLRAQIAMANLEGPLCTEGTPGKEPKEGRVYLFRTRRGLPPT